MFQVVEDNIGRVHHILKITIPKVQKLCQNVIEGVWKSKQDKFVRFF